nr:hypothetical protein DEO72_LG2g3861 [Ipomoea batatas]
MGHFDPLFLSSSPGSGSGKGQRKDLTSKKSLEFSLIRTGAVAPGVGKSLENGVALNTSQSLKRIEMLTFLAPLALPSNTFSGSVISPILKENELHTWNERYMKRLIESGERVGLLSCNIQPKSNSSLQSCFAWKGEKTWNETLKG